MNQEEKILKIAAMNVLDAGMKGFDGFHQSQFMSIRKGALKMKAKALINHDRFITGEFIKRGTI